MTGFIPRDDRERLANLAVDFNVDGLLKARGIAGKTLAQALVQFGIVRLPQLVPDADAIEINVAVPELQNGFLGARGLVLEMLDSIDAPALLLFVRPSGIEHHAVAQFQRGLQMQGHFPALDPGDGAQEHAAFFPEARMDQALVIDAAKPAGVQAPGERHLHVVPRRSDFLCRGRIRGRIRRRRPETIQGLAIDPGDAGDIFRRLEPALNFERGHAGAHEFRQHVQPGQILGAQQIAPVAQRHREAVGKQLIGHPAGLGAFAAVGRAAAERFAGETLAGISHAQGAMHKNLQRERRRREH